MKKFALALLGAVAMVAALSVTAEITGKVQVADTLPLGDAAVREMALQIGLDNPDLTIEIARTPVAEALKALDAGKTDLVLTTEDQLPETYRFRRRYADEVALVVVNSANSRDEFHLSELANIFAGTLGDWKSLNGSAYTFHRFGMTDGSPAETIFRRKVMGERQYAKGLYRKEEARQLLLLVEANPNTIAFIDYPAEALTLGVKAAKVGGIAPTVANLDAGKYPLQRSRVMVFGKKITPAARYFIQEFSRPEFVEKLRENGLYVRNN